MKVHITIFSLLLLMAGCGDDVNQNNESSENGKTVPVYAKQLHPTTFRHYLNIQGTVESDKTIFISPKTSATVEEVLVHAGDDVQRGDLLARLDGEITRSQVQEVKTRLELAEDLFERQKNLREQDIGSEVEFLQAKNQVESLRDQLSTLQEQYENYSIRATIGGTVNQVMLKEGETVGPTEPVFQIANSEDLKITAEISEAYITRVDKTDSVQVSFTSIDESFHKTLDVVSRVIDASNRTFRVEVDVPEMDTQIRPNMIAKLRINDFSRDNQIVVPVNTVQEGNSSNYLFVAEQGDGGWIAVQREVVPGLSYWNEIIIEEGLNPGDLLITTGYQDVVDGAAISIRKN